MSRRMLYVLCSTVALAQVRPQDPFDTALQAHWEARRQGNFEQAAARRDEVRTLLTQTPLDSPMLTGRVQNVVQLYRNSGRPAEARAVAQDALNRAFSLGASYPMRIQLLNIMADQWQQDGNLLKALAYREQAIAAAEAVPLVAARPPATPPGGVSLSGLVSTAGTARVVMVNGNRMMGFAGSNNTYLYQQLADLYRQLGRPEAAAKAMLKMRTILKDNPGALASTYEREGDLDQAIALYRKQADQVPASGAQVWETIGPLQSIANLYERQQRWDDAVASINQAAARLDASSLPQARSQAIDMRVNVAGLLQRSGQTKAADQLYQSLLTQAGDDRNGTQVRVLQAYARHLTSTDRAGQAEELLKGYLDNHANLQPWEESNILFALSNSAGSTGRSEDAAQYQQRAAERQRAAQQPQDAVINQKSSLDEPQVREAIKQGNLDEAVNLALRSIAGSGNASDGEQIIWRIQNLANELANRNAPDKAELLYRELFAALRTRSIDNLMPLTQAHEQYARYLMGRKDRATDTAAAIDRYAELLMASAGAETNATEQAARLRIQFAQSRRDRGDAERAAEDLLKLEESLSGTTSAPYLRALQTAADAYSLERGLPIHRQIVAISDLCFQPNDAQRAHLRMNAALAFARARQFEDAERLAAEALAVAEGSLPNEASRLAPQIEQIRRMKAESSRQTAR